MTFTLEPHAAPADASADTARAEAARAWLQAQWVQMPVTSTVDFEGTTISCRGWNLDAKHLPGLLLVHGYNAHARWWDHIAPSLSARYRVVAYDLSGAGDSGRRSNYNRITFAREALAIAEAFDFLPVTLIGHSFGGMICTFASIMVPERVARLVVADTGYPPQGDKLGQILRHGDGVYPDRATILSRFRLAPPGKWPNRDILDYIAQHSIRECEDGWRWKFDSNSSIGLNAEDTMPMLSSTISVPTTFVHGALTEVMLPHRIARAMQLAPHAGPPVVIPAAHHHLMIEQPIAFASALAGILSQPVLRRPEASEMERISS